MNKADANSGGAVATQESGHSKTDFREAVGDPDFLPGCDVINSDVAHDPEFIEMIEARLKRVGNNCYGDISAALEKSPKVDEFTHSLINNFFATPQI